MHLGRYIAGLMAAALARVMPKLNHAGYGPRNTKSRGYRTINRLNRSRHWPAARDYKHVRQMSPYPVR